MNEHRPWRMDPPIGPWTGAGDASTEERVNVALLALSHQPRLHAVHAWASALHARMRVVTERFFAWRWSARSAARPTPAVKTLRFMQCVLAKAYYLEVHGTDGTLSKSDQQIYEYLSKKYGPHPTQAILKELERALGGPLPDLDDVDEGVEEDGMAQVTTEIGGVVEFSERGGESRVHRIAEE